MVIGSELGAIFNDACLAYFIRKAQALEDGKRHEQKRFADMKPGAPVLFQKRHPPSLLRQKSGYCGTGRTSTYDKDVTMFNF